MQAAANALDAAFTSYITINIEVGYGEFLGGALPNQNTSEGNIDYQGDDGLGIVTSYQNFRTLLISHASSADQLTAVENLPNVTDLAGHSGNYVMGSAQAKALGVLAPNNAALDGAVGMGKNFTGSVLFNGALHELTHAMGRIAGTTLDLFRFNEDGSGNHVFGGAIPANPAYFSINGGATDLGDFGIKSDPGDFLVGGVQDGGSSNPNVDDPFDETVGLVGLSSVDITMMNVLGFAVSPPPPPPSTPSRHEVLAGDFNGDGDADVLFQNDNGQAYGWLVNGNSVAGAGSMGGSVSPSWHVAATGDFTGNGKSDILFQNDDGQLYEWQMNALSVMASGAVGGSVSPSWHVVGTGDFAGTGKSDILFQNDDGQLYEWQMNGFTVAVAGSVGSNVSPSWHVVGTGDFNGDGKSDILFQNDDGQLYEWQMNGFTVVAAGSVGGNVSPSWHVAEIGDFNGDGKSDILFQNDNGQVWQWQMNGFSVTASSSLGGNVSPSWHVV